MPCEVDYVLLFTCKIVMYSYRFEYVAEIAGLEDCFQHWPKLKEL